MLSLGLAIYNDRMEIFNNGGLMPGLSIKKLKKGCSEPRNILISNILHRGNLIEMWGRGIPSIIESCIKANDPAPEFVADHSHFSVVFKFPHSIRPPVIEIGEIPEQEDLNFRQREALVILKNHGALSTNGILDKLKSPISVRTLRNELSDLESKGMVRSTGHTITKVWFIPGNN